MVKLLDNRMVRFLLAGGLAALVNFGSRFIYSLFVSFSTAVLLAFMTGLTTGFLLNKIYVFTTSKNTITQEMSWFVFINILALMQTWGLSVYLSHVLPGMLPVSGESGKQLTYAIAHGAGILLPVFTSYVGHKYLTFRE
ncbi:MAG: GtrA family protein [Halioglobus sp.]|nr:GtrA family protein [Halioglobus sp.]